jgi:hypothetical protein
LHEVQARLEVKKAPQVEQEFPRLALANMELEPEIALAVQTIMANTSLQPGSNIQSDIRAILTDYIQ